MDHQEARNAREGEKGPKFQKRHFLGFPKFFKTCFLYQYSIPKYQIWGSWGQKRPFYTKNVYFRFFENINLLKTRKLKKLRHAKSISSYNSQYFSTGQSFLESGRNCAHNLFVRFWNFAPRTWGFPREPEKPFISTYNSPLEWQK